MILPLSWHYLVKNFLQVFFLTLVSLIGSLIVMRFKEIAEFAVLSSNASSILLFTLYQLPYLLPEAIPISAVIAASLTFQKLSQSGELTAFRSSGFSLGFLMTPILLTAFTLSLINLSIVGELAPYCKVKSRELSRQVMASNPFYIFHKISEGKIPNSFLELQTLRGGKNAKNLLFLIRQETSERVAVISAKELRLQDDSLTGKEISIISSADSGNENHFDHLMIENQKSMTTKAATLSELLRPQEKEPGFEHLPLRKLFIKAFSYPSFWKNGPSLEFARRLSIGLSPLLFTTIGAALGMTIGRRESRKNLFIILGLTLFYLLSFMGGKEMKKMPLIGWTLFFIPYPVLLLFAKSFIHKISRGKDS